MAGTSSITTLAVSKNTLKSERERLNSTFLRDQRTAAYAAFGTAITTYSSAENALLNVIAPMEVSYATRVDIERSVIYASYSNAYDTAVRAAVIVQMFGTPEVIGQANAVFSSIDEGRRQVLFLLAYPQHRELNSEPVLNLRTMETNRGPLISAFFRIVHAELTNGIP